MNSAKILRWGSIAVIGVGILLGLWHAKIALRGIFVFRENEPLAVWIGVLCGPLSTLPAAMVSLFSRKVGAYWLIAGACISFTSFIFWPGFLVQEIPVILLKWCGPMMALGGSMLLLERARAKRSVS